MKIGIGLAITQRGSGVSAPTITAAAASLVDVGSPAVPSITLTGTTTRDLSAGRWGGRVKVNGVSAGNVDGVGAASSQSLTFTLASIGAVAGDYIEIDPGYSLTDPAVTWVYASEMSTPIYITATITTPTISGGSGVGGGPVVGDTLTGTNGTALCPWGGTRSVLWLANDVSTGDTDTSYTVVSGDIGKVLNFRNTSTHSSGTVSVDSLDTDAVASAASVVRDAFSSSTSPYTAGTSVSITNFSTTVANTMILVAMTWRGGSDILENDFTITVDGNAATKIDYQASLANENLGTAIYGYYSAAQLTNVTIAASWTNSQNVRMGVAAYRSTRNLLALTPNTDYGITGYESASATAKDLTTNVKANGSVLFGVVSEWNNTTWTEDAGTTTIAETEGDTCRAWLQSSGYVNTGDNTIGGDTGTGGGFAAIVIEVPST